MSSGTERFKGIKVYQRVKQSDLTEEMRKETNVEWLKEHDFPCADALHVSHRAEGAVTKLILLYFTQDSRGIPGSWKTWNCGGWDLKMPSFPKEKHTPWTGDFGKV